MVAVVVAVPLAFVAGGLIGRGSRPGHHGARVGSHRDADPRAHLPSHPGRDRRHRPARGRPPVRPRRHRPAAQRQHRRRPLLAGRPDDPARQPAHRGGDRRPDEAAGPARPRVPLRAGDRRRRPRRLRPAGGQGQRHPAGHRRPHRPLALLGATQHLHAHGGWPDRLPGDLLRLLPAHLPAPDDALRGGTIRRNPAAAAVLRQAADPRLPGADHELPRPAGSRRPLPDPRPLRARRLRRRRPRQLHLGLQERQRRGRREHPALGDHHGRRLVLGGRRLRCARAGGRDHRRACRRGLRGSGEDALLPLVPGGRLPAVRRHLRPLHQPLDAAHRLARRGAAAARLRRICRRPALAARHRRRRMGQDPPRADARLDRRPGDPGLAGRRILFARTEALPRQRREGGDPLRLGRDRRPCRRRADRPAHASRALPADGDHAPAAIGRQRRGDLQRQREELRQHSGLVGEPRGEDRDPALLRPGHGRGAPGNPLPARRPSRDHLL